MEKGVGRAGEGENPSGEGKPLEVALWVTGGKGEGKGWVGGRLGPPGRVSPATGVNEWNGASWHWLCPPPPRTSPGLEAPVPHSPWAQSLPTSTQDRGESESLVARWEGRGRAGKIHPLSSLGDSPSWGHFFTH